MAKKILERLIIGSWLGGFIVMYLTFLMAYTHPSKSICIDINQLGEANIEFIVFNVLAILTCIYLAKTWADNHPGKR